MHNKYINRNGYVVRKSSLTEADIASVKKDLTVFPFSGAAMVTGGGVGASSFRVYRENSNKLYVPPFYGTERFGPCESNSLLEDPSIEEDVSVVFRGALKEEQMAIAKEYLDQLSGHPGGILQLPCGFGKTVLAIYILSVLRVKTIIVVHKEFLMNQWIERLRQFLVQPRIGILQQNKMEVEDRDVVIAMVQSVCLKDYPPEIFSGFGLAIYDECHHLGAEMFSKAFRRIVTRWTLGLSATPNRKDGLRRVFEWHLGRVIVQREASRSSDLTVERIRFRSTTGVFPGVYSPQTRSAMITYICELGERNDRIVQRVLEICTADDRRKVLLLSERRNQLDCIHRALKTNGCDSGFYVGGMKQIRLDESAAKTVILGTFQMASEGMDIPALNTVILCSPKSDIEQSVGRILRKKHAISPLVIDVIDEDYQNFMTQFYIRLRFYKKMNYRAVSALGEGTHEEVEEEKVDTSGVEVSLVENNNNGCLFVDV